MRFPSALLLILMGVVAGIAFVVSCGDDTPTADAAGCMCPAAEAPLAGRLSIVEDVKVLPPNSPTPVSLSVGCPTGATLLNGGCVLNNGGFAGPNVILEQSGPVSGSWFCSFRSNHNMETEVRIKATCLLPAP